MTRDRHPQPPVDLPAASAFSLGLRIFGGIVALGLLVSGSRWWRADAVEPWEGGTLRIGYAIEAPYAFVDPTGRVTGEGPEIAREVAARLGIRDVTWFQTDFGTLIQELEDGRIDVIAAGLFITPERSRRVAFSRPTFVAGAALLVAAGNPRELHSYEDILAKGARVAVLARSVEERVMRRVGNWPEGRLIPVSTAETGMQAVADGRAEAFALSAPSLRWAVKLEKRTGVELAAPFRPPAELAAGAVGGFAFRAGDRVLRQRWDEELARFVGSAEHLVLIRRLGFDLTNVARDGAAMVAEK